MTYYIPKTYLLATWIVLVLKIILHCFSFPMCTGSWLKPCRAVPTSPEPCCGAGSVPVQMEQQNHSNLLLESLHSNSPLLKKQFPSPGESCLCCFIPHPSLLVFTRDTNITTFFPFLFQSAREELNFWIPLNSFPDPALKWFLQQQGQPFLLGLQKACVPGCLSLAFHYFLTSSGDDLLC